MTSNDYNCFSLSLNVVGVIHCGWMTLLENNIGFSWKEKESFIHLFRYNMNLWSNFSVLNHQLLNRAALVFIQIKSYDFPITSLLKVITSWIHLRWQKSSSFREIKKKQFSSSMKTWWLHSPFPTRSIFLGWRSESDSAQLLTPCICSSSHQPDTSYKSNKHALRPPGI